MPGISTIELDKSYTELNAAVTALHHYTQLLSTSPKKALADIGKVLFNAIDPSGQLLQDYQDHKPPYDRPTTVFNLNLLIADLKQSLLALDHPDCKSALLEHTDSKLRTTDRLARTGLTAGAMILGFFTFGIAGVAFAGLAGLNFIISSKSYLLPSTNSQLLRNIQKAIHKTSRLVAEHLQSAESIEVTVAAEASYSQALAQISASPPRSITITPELRAIVTTPKVVIELLPKPPASPTPSCDSWEDLTASVTSSADSITLKSR